MIVAKRRRAPVAQNYRGVWSGLGAVPPPKYETCGITDSACVARNDVVEQAYNQAVVEDLWSTYNKGPMPVGWMTAGDSPVLQQQIAADYNRTIPSAAVQPTEVQYPASGGHVTFTSSRGSNALQVGDTWLVSITGATPNAQVMAKVGSDTTPMGMTDSSGNFSLAGTAHAADVGSWNETWAVGGVPSGSFSFTVSAAPSALQNAQIPVPVLPAVPGILQPVGSSAAASSSTVIGGFDLSSIPMWGWLAAAGVALFVFGGGRGR